MTGWVRSAAIARAAEPSPAAAGLPLLPNPAAMEPMSEAISGATSIQPAGWASGATA